jgi:hypothetical protein
MKVASCISKQNDIVKHINGKGYEAVIKQVKGHETDVQRDLRRQLSKPSTIPITKIIIDELNRWTNAQGTTKRYDFGGKRDIEVKFKDEVLGHVWKGKSMDYFVNNDLKEAIDTEFNGFMVITKGYRVQNDDGEVYEERGEYVIKVNDKASFSPYIIFISIDDVLDFSKSGSNVDYIVYKYGERVEVENSKERTIEQYRFLDDKQDRIYEKDGANWYLVEQGDFMPKANMLGYVPAIQISNTKFDMKDDCVMRSQLSFLVPQLDRYLEKDSEHIHSEVLHAFPRLWMTGFKCPTCQGEKKVINDDSKSYYDSKKEKGEYMTCPTCVGEGSIVPKDSTQVAKVPQVIPEGFKPFSGGVGGYITPPVEIIEYQDRTLKELRDSIIYAGTSNKNIVAMKFKTATENNMNIKTLEDKIDDRLSNIEEVETFLTDAIAKMHRDYKRYYKGCVIKYSRRLYYKPESDILLDIESSKRAGMPNSYIRSLQIELYRAKYIHSPIELSRAILLTNLENLVGFTFSEIENNRYISDYEKQYKFYFNDIVEEIEKDNDTSIIDYKGGDEKSIKKEIERRLKLKTKKKKDD